MSGALEDVGPGFSKPNRWWTCAAVAMAILMAAKILLDSELVLVNLSPSVPRGIYVRAAPSKATYVTFCLDQRHREAEFFAAFCSPSTPNGTRILKRIGCRLLPESLRPAEIALHRDRPTQERHAFIVALTVEGDTDLALDSRVLGPVSKSQVKGWWVPLW